jgi:broad specificity phosphatase PhoE
MVVCAMGVGTASAQGVVFVVRHAKKGAAPPGDPGLTAEGKQRAEALRDALKEAGIKAIITSPAGRTN